MNISIFGLGYVGAVSAGCLAADGHTVIGVDPNTTKVDLINRGLAPIVEKDIGDMIADSVTQGRLSATTSVRDAVQGSELSLICVGTPSQLNEGCQRQGQRCLGWILLGGRELGLV